MLNVQRCHLWSADMLSTLLQLHSNCPTSGFWIFCSIPVNVEFSLLINSLGSRTQGLHLLPASLSSHQSFMKARILSGNMLYT